MGELNRTSCCGVREYDGLTDYDSIKDCLLDVHRRFYDLDDENDGWDSGAFILFTCPARYRKIAALQKYIEENKLGTCTVTPSRLNPNSDNNLIAMLYGVNHTAFKKWYAKNKENEREDGWFIRGDMVANDVTGSKRYGEIARVTKAEGDDVWVLYENGMVGHGQTEDYILVD